jgi:YbbR domain-containing protein
MVVAGLLSLLLWAVVRSQDAPRELPGFFAAALTPQGLDGDRYVVTKIDSTVPLKLVGTEAEIRGVDQSSLYAIVDLSGAQPGSRNYRVEVGPEMLRRFLPREPITVPVTIEPRATKSVEVSADAKGELGDPKLIVERFLLNPTTVRVSGPKSKVDMLVQLRARVDLAEIKPNSRQPLVVSVEPMGEGGRPLSDLRLDPLFVRVEPVLVAAPERKLIVLDPVLTGSPADGYMIAGFETVPERIQVTGKSLALAGMSTAATSPIDVTGLSADRSFPVDLILPEGVRPVNPGQVYLQVRIKAIRPALPGAGVP